jgi:hypothetical protein
MESVISEAWSLPLSAKDRDNFITSSSLVNKTWASAFAKISLEDSHISNPRYVQQYLRILRNESPVYAKYPNILPDLLGNSLSFTMDTHASAIGHSPMFITPFGEQERLGVMLSDTLYTIATLSYLPNLRRISIEYANWGSNDIFDNFRLSPFPAQVTELDIKFTTTPGIKNVAKPYHRYPGRVPWSLPSITRLSVVGASANFVADMVATCLNLETLEVEDIPQLMALFPLLANTHRVLTAGLLLPSPSHTSKRLRTASGGTSSFRIVLAESTY